MKKDKTSVSSHGEKRVKMRLGLPAKAVDREVANAYARGKRRTEFTGLIRKYLDNLYAKGVNSGSATDIVVHGNNIFLFAGSILVTTWPLPPQHRIRKAKRKTTEEEEFY